MECVLLGWSWQTEQARLAIENASEHWRCDCVSSPDAACAALMSGHVDALYLLREDDALLSALHQATPANPPWLVADGGQDARLDALLPLENAARLPALLREMENAHRLPVLTASLLPALTPNARRFLLSLEMSPRLRAWDFLPDMLALCAAHPALLLDLNHRLYPLIAMRHGLTKGCVERRLRVAVESTWNKAPLDTLDRFFGQSIDPARGKPTNKEFLCQLCEYMALGHLPPMHDAT